MRQALPNWLLQSLESPGRTQWERTPVKVASLFNVVPGYATIRRRKQTCLPKNQHKAGQSPTIEYGQPPETEGLTS